MSPLLRLARSTAFALVSIALVDCGGGVTPTKTSPPVGDGGTTADGGPAPGSVIGECGPSDSCPSGSSCYFPIGSCSSKPQCVVDPAPGSPSCKAIEELCGCDGTTVTTGCGFPSGFASGATTGTNSGQDCAPIGTHPPSDAGSPVEAGTDVGACADGPCPAGSSCFWPIGDCSSTGRCITVGSGPECGAIEELCGCNGTMVTSGCGYPTGYASGPSSGSESCETPSFDGGGQGEGGQGHGP